MSAAPPAAASAAPAERATAPRAMTAASAWLHADAAAHDVPLFPAFAWPRPETLRRHVIALAAVLVALALQALLPRTLEPALPLATLFAAVAMTVWFGGWGPGVLAATLGFLATAWLLLPPAWTSGAWQASQWLSLAIYLFCCALIIGFGEARLRALRRLERETVQRRAAETRAAAEADRLRVTLASIGDGVIVVGATGRVVACNPVAQALTGWRKGDAIGRDLAEVLDSGDGDGARSAATALEDLAAPIVDASGRRVGAVLVLHELPAQHAAERQRAQAHAALNAMLQSAPLAVVVVDAEPALVRYWNDAAECLFGWRADEVIGRPLPGVPDEKRAEVQIQHERVRRGATLVDVETWRHRADGGRIDLSMSAAPLRDTDLRLTGTLLLFTDITDHKRAEAALRDSEAQARLALAVARLGTWRWDAHTETVHADARTREIFGLAPAVALRVPDLLRCIHPDDRARVERAVQAALAPHGDGQAGEEFRCVHADGSVHWVVACGQALLDGEGASRHVTRALGSLLDTSERKRHEDAQALAERRKDEFLATLAHELRNPLAPLRNGVQLLRMLAADLPAAQRPLDIMERQIAQMVRLIDDLLDVGRVSADKLQLQRRRIDVARVVQDAVETSQPLLDAAGHRLTVALPREPVFVDADATRLCQVIANLLNNAAKFTPRAGSVRVSVERQGAEVGVAVEDDGHGIPGDVLPDIFEMFTQVGRGRDGAQGGLGIGLAIARRLVELHGGRLQAHSSGPGTGSRFQITLPLAEPPRAADAHAADPRAPHAPPAGRAARTGCRILVADDNADAAESLSLLLALRGNETRVACDGVEALELAAAFQPDIALLDIGMPRLDGYELARRLRGQPGGRDLRLVAVTGWGQDADRQRSASAGFDLHWVKPVDPAALDALVASVASGLPTPNGAAH